MTHPRRVAENRVTHPFLRAQKLMTHPLSAPADPPILFDQSLSYLSNNFGYIRRQGDLTLLSKRLQIFQKSYAEAFSRKLRVNFQGVNKAILKVTANDCYSTAFELSTKKI